LETKKLYKITRHGRYGKIDPIPDGSLSRTLEKYMTYQKQGAQFMPNPAWSFVKLYRKGTGTFPWGMLKIVEKVMGSWYEKSGERFEIVGSQEIMLNEERFVSLGNHMRPYQRESLRRLIENAGGIICLPTGAGKTFVAIQFLKYLNKHGLIVVHTIDLREQWIEQLENHGVKADVRTYQSIKDLKALKHYGIVCFDECHHVSAKTLYRVAIQCSNSILIGLSATPYREDGEDMKINAALGDIIHEVDRRELIEKGFLSDADVVYVSYNNHCNERWVDYQTIYKQYIVNNDERNEEIVNIIDGNKDRKILVLVSQIEHGTKLSEMMESEHLFLHGKIKDRKVPKDMNVIVATTIFDEGVDLPDFDMLVLAAGGKSSIKLAQRVGRILRFKIGKRAIIYDFVDESRYLKIHYKRRRKILEGAFLVKTE
jgi:superfamily II DNA or RNA helicase